MTDKCQKCGRDQGFYGSTNDDGLCADCAMARYQDAEARLACADVVVEAAKALAARRHTNYHEEFNALVDALDKFDAEAGKGAT